MVPFLFGLTQSEGAPGTIEQFESWRRSHPTYVAEYEMRVADTPQPVRGIMWVGENQQQFISMMWGRERWRYSQKGSSSLLLSDATREYDLVQALEGWASPEPLTTLLEHAYLGALIPGSLKASRDWQRAGTETIGEVSTTRWTSGGHQGEADIWIADDGRLIRLRDVFVQEMQRLTRQFDFTWREGEAAPVMTPPNGYLPMALPGPKYPLSTYSDLSEWEIDGEPALARLRGDFNVLIVTDDSVALPVDEIKAKAKEQGWGVATVTQEGSAGPESIVDPGWLIVRKYELELTPAVIFVNSEGMVRGVWKGYAQGDLPRMIEAFKAAKEYDEGG